MSDIEISCEIIHETASALLISDDGDNRIWIPRSQIFNCDRQLNSNENDTAIIEIPEWLAIEKGLV